MYVGDFIFGKREKRGLCGTRCGGGERDREWSQKSLTISTVFPPVGHIMYAYVIRCDHGRPPEAHIEPLLQHLAARGS